MRDFNSHARVGRDFVRFQDFLCKCNFNSHARVGRDMNPVVGFAGYDSDFNSHARVGRDITAPRMKCNYILFQLTRPCRA